MKQQKASAEMSKYRHLSKPLAPKHSTIHFAQSPAPIEQPSFPQVFDGGARTDATLASQMPRIECESDSCSPTIADGIVGTHSRTEYLHFATNCDYACRFCHVINSCRFGSR